MHRALKELEKETKMETYYSSCDSSISSQTQSEIVLLFRIFFLYRSTVIFAEKKDERRKEKEENKILLRSYERIRFFFLGPSEKELFHAALRKEGW